MGIRERGASGLALELHLHGKLSIFSFLICPAQKKKLKFSKGAIIYSSYEIKENSLVCTKEKGKQLYEVISIDNPSK